MLKDAGKIGLYLRGGDARLQPAHHVKPPEIRRREQRRRLLQVRLLQHGLRLERERQRHIGRVGDGLVDACEFRREHADDRNWHVVDAGQRAHRVRAAAEPRHPVLVADHRNRRRVRSIVVRRDRAALAGRRSERAIVVA